MQGEPRASALVSTQQKPSMSRLILFLLPVGGTLLPAALPCILRLSRRSPRGLLVLDSSRTSRRWVRASQVHFPDISNPNHSIIHETKKSGFQPPRSRLAPSRQPFPQRITRSASSRPKVALAANYRLFLAKNLQAGHPTVCSPSLQQQNRRCCSRKIHAEASGHGRHFTEALHRQSEL